MAPDPKKQQATPTTSFDQQSSLAPGAGSLATQPRPKTSAELDQGPPPGPLVNWKNVRPLRAAAGPAGANDATQQVLNPEVAPLDDADIEVIKRAIEQYITATYDKLELGLTNALTAIAEPRVKQEHESFALKVIGTIVEELTELALNYASAGLAGVVKAAFGGNLAEAAKATGDELAIQGAKGVVRAVEHSNGEPGERSGEGGESFQNPGAKSLVDEFATRQKISLIERRADANVFGAQIIAAGRKDPQKARQFATELRAGSRRDDIAQWFSNQITFEWMNFAAKIATGKEQLDDKVNFQDLANSGYGIDVHVNIPDTIEGVMGLTLREIRADGGPGVIRTLHNLKQSLLDVPVLRKVWLHTEGDVGALSLVGGAQMVILPSGERTFPPDSRILAAIGKFSPLDVTDLTDDKLARGRTGPDPEVMAQDVVNGIPTELDPKAWGKAPSQVITELASTGATLLRSWIGNHTTAEVK